MLERTISIPIVLRWGSENLTPSLSTTLIKYRFLAMKIALVEITSLFAEIFEESNTSAGILLNQMKSAKVVEPVTGHGKGKFRIKS